MTWLNANWTLAVALWCVAGAVLDTVGHALPAGAWQRVLLGLARLCPANMVGAFKGLSGQVPAPGVANVLAEVAQAASAPPPKGGAS